MIKFPNTNLILCDFCIHAYSFRIILRRKWYVFSRELHGGDFSFISASFQETHFQV